MVNKVLRYSPDVCSVDEIKRLLRFFRVAFFYVC